MTLNETYALANGIQIPKLGLGTWLIDDDKVADVVRNAIDIGYRNIDTAQAYGNERGVGEGVRASGPLREDLFVSTKLAAEIKDYDAAVAAIDESLAKLDIGYIDLMLIHSPEPWEDYRGGSYDEGNRQAWRALEDAHKAGKIRTIGVSNFQPSDIENILQVATVAPTVNQILVHVGNTPTDIIDYCEAHDILIEAYSPIAHGEVLASTEIAEIAGRYEVSVPQLCIRYTIQLGAVSLPKTSNLEHLRSNADVDFVISDADMQVLSNLVLRDYGDSAAFPVYSGK
ncbi:aldo/keto reductase [Microbacterium sp. ISL-103]|uniref:aldo/keto reductase n=1 Tax=Microbacterium sp. ISL-103 TaxID=2819156 RepID=UPI001BE5C354|nr:aldo/keto reductase [Microbacterium sp. ISL-103]MBT2475808.1 aldo/keto reductase [Microbacterium sp. ISL-103]